MSCWSGFLSLRLLRRRGGKAHRHNRDISGTKVPAAARFTPRWHLGVAQARQSRADPSRCPAAPSYFALRLDNSSLKSAE